MNETGTDENKFVELADEVANETRQAAERLASDPIVNEAPTGSYSRCAARSSASAFASERSASFARARAALAA